MMSRKKVLVALSGGVDSAVSAALLKKQGFDVFGAHFLFFDGAGSKKSLNKAKKVAESLDIDLEVVDARKDFKKKVIDYFVESYEKGITPNPCVVCNKEMKFRLLLELLKKFDADFVATGHYARIKRKVQNAKRKIKGGFFYRLFEAVDKTKDQSYFLYRLNQRELSKIIFPLGDHRKAETKKLAKKFKLPVFGEEESQDVCFLTNKDTNQFLRKNIKPASGNIVDEKGNILARHKGLPFYTIGQRKGIEIGGMGPYFVISKDSKKNQLVVSNDSKRLFSKMFSANRVNWISNETKLPLSAQIQIRYHAEKISAIIKKGKKREYSIETTRPLRAATPGQSAVFYKNNEVLGGGIIV